MKKTFIQFIDDHKIWNLDLEDLIYANPTSTLINRYYFTCHAVAF